MNIGMGMRIGAGGAGFTLGPNLWDGVGVTVGAGWTDNGNGSYTHTTGVDTVNDDIGLVNGGVYEVVFTVSGRSAGTIYVVLGGASNGTIRNTNATFTERFVASTNALAYLQPNTTFNGTVSAISIRKVT
jgi:hypothetical protein